MEIFLQKSKEGGHVEIRERKRLLPEWKNDRVRVGFIKYADGEREVSASYGHRLGHAAQGAETYI